MGLLEQISQMRKEGKRNEEINSNLQEQGVSPKAIHEALNQEQIKKAVSNPMTGNEQMQPSIMNNEGIPSPTGKDVYTPKVVDESQAPTGDVYSPQAATAPQTSYPQMQEQTEEYYPQENFSEYSAGSSSTELMIEIAEQVFSEKINKLQNQLESLNEFATIAGTKIKSNEDRLKRIEATMDKLQLAILEKVGSYGSGIDSIKKEMSMMQDSFGKVINPLLDKKEHHKKTSHKK
jgi:hypothetical protein